jgi:predicted nuclease of predicted toxin-antitoxin system
MLRLAIDEDFNNHILRGVQLLLPGLDALRVQDAHLPQKDDPDVLEWAASEGRVLFTQDANTMTAHAYARIKAGLYTPGVFVIPQGTVISEAINDMLLVVQTSYEGEWEGQVVFLPLR